MGSFNTAGLPDIDTHIKTTSTNSMSGRGRTGRGQGRGSRAGRSGRGSNYSGSTQSRKTQGKCADLGTDVFDYNTSGAADQTRTTWKAVIIYAGAKYGQDIANELENRKTLIIPAPTHSAETLAAHKDATDRRAALAVTLKAINTRKLTALAALAGDDLDSAIRHAELEAKMAQDDVDSAKPLPIKLEGDEHATHSNAWKTHRDRTAALEKDRGKVYSLVRGQCSQVLVDKMECEIDWKTVSESNDPPADGSH